MRICYINLDRRTDRRATMEARLAALGLIAERVPAVSPADLTEDQRRRSCDPRAYHYLTEGELGCSLSHMRAMTRIAESGDPFGLILEDDALLSPRLPGFLAAFDAAPPRVGLLRIETDLAAQRLEPRPDGAVAGIGIFRCHNLVDGAAGYIVSQGAARHIAASADLLSRAVDRAMFNPFAPLARRFITRQTSPALVVQDVHLESAACPASPSDLVAERDRRGALSRQRSYFRRLRHDAREFIDREFRMGPIKLWHQYARGAAKRVIPFADE